MSINNTEEKYKDIINSLKQLSKVNAPPNFETDLMRKINSYDEKPVSFWEKLFTSRWIPATAGVAFASILLIFFVVNQQNYTMEEDAFSVIPKLRIDDFSSVDSFDYLNSFNSFSDSIFDDENIESERTTEKQLTEIIPTETIVSTNLEESINKTNFTFKALKPAESKEKIDTSGSFERIKLE